MPKRILFKVNPAVFSDVTGREIFLKEAVQRLRLPPDLAASVTFSPLFTDKRLSEEVLKRLEQQALEGAKRQRKDYKPPNFLTFLVMKIPDGVDPDKFLQRLKSEDVKDIVEYAYVQPEGREPVDPTNNPDFPNQGYLQAGGINIVPVWPTPGGKGKPGLDGAGIRFADVERSWDLNHPDLMMGAVPRVELRYGDLHPNAVIRDHGTAVVGIVAAVDNTSEIVGIVPNVDHVMAYSWTSNGDDTPHEAIAAAAAELSTGDVLLIERCSVGLLNAKPQALPQETDLIAYEIILAATLRGVIVIEPAGNDGKNIDEFVFDDTTTFADRDSGALIVGSSRTDLTRNPNSNFGNRVDCFAWGEGVFTLTRPRFNGTSAASAIIAGAAVALQGYSKAVLGGVLAPDRLRDLFKNPALSALSAAAPGDRIGVMPDMQAIVDFLESS
jgi:hypothetical protein